MPGTQVFFFTGGIVKRILNFGSAAPIDIEILGYDLEEGSPYAKKIAEELRNRRADGKPLLTDVQISREENYPELDVKVDREKAGVLGISEQQVAQTVLTSLVGNTQFAPVPFTDPKTGNEYYINVRLDDRTAPRLRPGDVFVRTPAGNWSRWTPSQARAQQRPGDDQPQVPAAHHRRDRQRRAGQRPRRRQRAVAQARSTDCRRRKASPRSSAARPRRRRRPSRASSSRR